MADFVRGQRLSAEDMNAITRQLRSLSGQIAELQARMRSDSRFGEPCHRVRVRDVDGTGFDKFDIVHLGPQSYDSTDGGQLYDRTLDVSIPTTASAGRWGIIAQPTISTGSGGGGSESTSCMGYAYIGGIALTYVDVVDESHQYAECSNGEYLYLQSASSGSALIIDRMGGTGVQWAIVQWPVGGGGGGGSGSGGCSDPSDAVRYARIESVSGGGSAGYTYGVKRWNTTTEATFGDIIYVVSLNSMRYASGALVTLCYDDLAGGWAIADELGTFSDPADVSSSGDAASEDTWEIVNQEENDGVRVRAGYRTKYVYADNAIYGYSRLMTIGSLGQLQEIEAEVRTQLLPSGTFSTPTELSHTGEDPDEFDWEQSEHLDGVTLTVITGVVMSTTDMKLYRFTREMSFDSLGMLREITGESREVVADLDDECV